MQNKDPRAIDYWYALISDSVEESRFEGVCGDMIAALREEVPVMLSATMERTCNLQCNHCIYQPEAATAISQDQYGLLDIIENLAHQMPAESDGPHFITPRFLHDGRILNPWHLDVFRRLREVRPDMRLGLIDNGTWTRLASSFDDLRLDWLDISLDGMEEAHNRQRQNPHAFDRAVQGLTKGREILRNPSEGDKVTSLFTLTTINHREIGGVADFLFANGWVDEFHITPMTPAREVNKGLEIKIDEFAVAWRDVLDATSIHGDRKVFFRIYRIDDLAKLAAVVGTARFQRSVAEAEVNAITSELILDIDGISVSFLPASIWPQETFLVDADGVYRTAYSAQYTLAELASGMSVGGEDTRGYSVAQLSSTSSLKELYSTCVSQWWGFLGERLLNKELGFFRELSKQTA